MNSKAVLRWNILASPSLSEFIRARVLARLATRLTRDGCLLLTSDRFRDQTRNREDCLEKLRVTLLAAIEVPKIRRKTQPTRGSERRGKEAKQKNSSKKDLRRKPTRFD